MPLSNNYGSKMSDSVTFTGKPCNIKVYRMLYMRILTVKPNSCRQEKKKKTMSTPNQDRDAYKTYQVYTVRNNLVFSDIQT